MKLINLITLILIMGAAAATVGCKKDSDSSIIPGYWSPGDFRPRGLAREKAYKLQFLDNSSAPTATNYCSSGTTITDPNTTDPTNTASTGRCGAVYGIWLTGTSYQNSLGSEGIAVKNTHLPSATMMIKIVRFMGQPWDIILNLNGIVYTAQSSALELMSCESVDWTTPDYTAPDGTIYANSGVRLKLMYVRFLQDITLTSSAGTITIVQTGTLPDPTHPPTWYDSSNVQHFNLPATGDFILAQAL
ncbi:MAG: hypothetical protein KA369_04615 [Spirochaetes bacterium]|nr:hypothetical protein [Spirochaetota bacterium]